MPYATLAYAMAPAASFIGARFLRTDFHVTNLEGALFTSAFGERLATETGRAVAELYDPRRVKRREES
jgi:hypothetical protein